MAEVQLLGLTHYPPFAWVDADMAKLMAMMLADPGVPAAAKDPASWPEAMRQEWGTDCGETSAAHHRSALVGGFDRVRSAIERFDPDVILVWGDDQYENFREDVVPAVTVLAYPDREVRPYATHAASLGRSYWDEPNDLTFTVRGRPDIARSLTSALLERDFDVAYAYEPLHEEQLSHAFLNTVLFLDHQRRGFPWPIICMPINCYGAKVISAHGGWRPFGEASEPDPPSPRPERLMALGATTARWLRESPWRVSIVASSSWSHAFLVDRYWRLRPDTTADRRLYDAMVAGDFDVWQSLGTADVVEAGQQEVLNWCALVGAVRELGAPLAWSTFVETYVFNSNKVFAEWEPL